MLHGLRFCGRFGVVAPACAIVALVFCDASRTAAAARKPNIVVIVADDLGYAETNPTRGQQIPTPRIASLAAAGVYCGNGYVTCPVCSPTRAGLLTGRYQQRFGHEFNPGPPTNADERFGLPLSETTLADRLKKAGYATGMVGKWHLGFKPEYFPLRRGFDEFFGFLGGAHSYVDSHADASNPIYRNDKPVEEGAYLTDALGREAAAFVGRHRDHPFFLYLTFNAVHAPLQTPDKYRSRFPDIADPKRRTFAAMLSAMDDNVGLVLDKLAAEKLDSETLVFFISDNGGPTPSTTSRNDPLHGFKTQVWEGGIRVPYIVQWKGMLPAGKVYDQPVSSLDILPTALAAAGETLADGKPLDGVNLMPYWTGENTAAPHPSLYWRFGPQWAIRRDNYKLLKTGDSPVQLFDLAKDVSETRDLASQEPTLVKQLSDEYEAWNAQLESPRWKRNALPRPKSAQRVK